MKLITVEYLHRINACYVVDYASQDELDLVARIPPEGVSPHLVARCEDVRAADRVWLLAREDFIPATRLRLLACRWAARALRVAGERNERMWRLVRVTARCAVGKASAQELEAARAVAWPAARNAARDAARAAGMAADAAVARDDAWDVSRTAAWEAARAVAWTAARNAAKADEARADDAFDVAMTAAWDRMARDVQREVERGGPLCR
jgi:hypothetical protein